MSDGFLIRDASTADAPLIGRIFHQAWRETYRGLLPDAMVDGVDADTIAEEWAVKLAPGGGSFCLIAETDDGVAMGYGGGTLAGFSDEVIPELADKGPSGLLDSLYVLKDHHSGGLGRTLVAGIAAGLTDVGMSRMAVVVLATNPAVAFYKRLGAEMVLERERVHRAHLCPEVVLAWPLPLSFTP